MRSFFAVVLLVLSLDGCRLLEGAHVSRPAVFWNGRPLRSVMINATPPRYGLGEAAGDIVLGEFRVDLTRLELEGGGALRIEGTVARADTGERLAAVSVREIAQGITTREVRSDRDGRFALAVGPGEGAILVLSTLGFRALELDLGRLRNAARRQTS
jgi:hypothetical protein